MNSKVIIGSTIAGGVGYYGTKMLLGYEEKACVAAGLGIAVYAMVS